MDRRETFLTQLGAYVIAAVGGSYALAALTDPYHADVWLLAFFLVMPIVHVAAGATFTRAWALLLPAIPVATAAPAGDVFDQLPLWAFLLVLSPGASLFVAVGVLARRLARRPTALDAVWAAIVLLVLGWGVAMLAAIPAGWDPWEGTSSPESGVVFVVALVVTCTGLAATFVAAAIHGSRRGWRAPTSLGATTSRDAAR